MRYYNVKLTAFCNVLVKAENADDALQRATHDADYGDFNLDTSGPAKLVPSEELERYQIHADRTLEMTHNAELSRRQPAKRDDGRT